MFPFVRSINRKRLLFEYNILQFYFSFDRKSCRLHSIKWTQQAIAWPITYSMMSFIVFFVITIFAFVLLSRRRAVCPCVSVQSRKYSERLQYIYSNSSSTTDMPKKKTHNSWRWCWQRSKSRKNNVCYVGKYAMCYVASKIILKKSSVFTITMTIIMYITEWFVFMFYLSIYDKFCSSLFNAGSFFSCTVDALVYGKICAVFIKCVALAYAFQWLIKEQEIIEW